MLTLLSTLAVAAPLDDAAADGRPIVVIVSREPRLYEAAVWLAAAEGAPRERQHEVVLVLAQPEELAAWTGDAALASKLREDPLAYALVRVSAARTVKAWANVRVPNLRDLPDTYPPHDDPLLPVSRDPGDTLSPLAGRAGVPGDTPTPSQPRAPRRAEAEQRDEGDADTFDWASLWGSDTRWTTARQTVVEAFDAALRAVLVGAPRRVIPPDVAGTTSGVVGAALCTNPCGLICLPPPPPAGEPAPESPVLGVFTASLCGMGHVGPLQSEFLLRWPR